MTPAIAAFLSIFAIASGTIAVLLLSELLRRLKRRRGGSGTSRAEPLGDRRPNPA
jgi:hypothetical protein